MNHFRIYEEIGMGSMYSVFKGRRKKTIDFVAVKKVKKAHRNIVFHEVHMMKKLGQHPNVVTLYQWFETTRHYWLIEELLGGSVLDDVISQDSPLPETSVRRFAMDVALGLYHVHSRGVASPSIYPQDLLLGVNGSLKISRFTEAVQVAQCSPVIPEDGDGCGCFPLTSSDTIINRRTMWYKAPEVLVRIAKNSTSNEALPVIDEVADLWAYGVLLYELAGGLLPSSRESFASIPCDTAEVESRKLTSLISMLLNPIASERPTWSTIIAHPFFKGELQAQLFDIHRSNKKTKKDIHDSASLVKSTEPPRPLSAPHTHDAMQREVRPVSAANGNGSLAPSSSMRSFVLRASDMNVKPVITCRCDPPVFSQAFGGTLGAINMLTAPEFLALTGDEQQRHFNEYVATMSTNPKVLACMHALLLDTRIANMFISSSSFIQLLMLIDRSEDDIVGALGHILGLTVRFCTTIPATLGRNSMLWFPLLKISNACVSRADNSSWNVVSALGELLFYAATQTTLDPTVRLNGESASVSREDSVHSINATPITTPRGDMRPASAVVTETHLTVPAQRVDDKSVWPFPADSFHCMMSLATITVMMHLEKVIDSVHAQKYGVKDSRLTSVPSTMLGYAAWGVRSNIDALSTVDENDPFYLASRSALRTLENICSSPTASLLAFLFSSFSVAANNDLYRRMTACDITQGAYLADTLYALIDQSAAVVVSNDNATLMPLMPLTMFTSITCILMRLAVHAPREMCEVVMSYGQRRGIHPLYPLMAYLQPSARLASKALGNLASTVTLLLLQSASAGKSSQPPFIPCHPMASFVMYILQAKKISVLLRARAILLLRAILECEHSAFVVTWLPLSKPLNAAHLSKAVEPADIQEMMNNREYTASYATHVPTQFEITASCLKRGALSALGIYNNAIQDGSFSTLHAAPNRDDLSREDEVSFFNGCVSHVVTFFKTTIPAISNRLVAELTRLPTPEYPSLFPVPNERPKNPTSNDVIEVAVGSFAAFFGLMKDTPLMRNKCSELVRLCSQKGLVDFYDYEEEYHDVMEDFGILVKSHMQCDTSAENPAPLPNPIRRMKDVIDAWQVAGMALCDEWLLHEMDDDLISHILPHLSDALAVCSWQGGWLVPGSAEPYNPIWGELQHSLYCAVEMLLRHNRISVTVIWSSFIHHLCAISSSSKLSYEEQEIVFALIGDIVSQTPDIRVYRDTLTLWVVPTCFSFLKRTPGPASLLALKIVNSTLDSMPQEIAALLLEQSYLPILLSYLDITCPNNNVHNLRIISTVFKYIRETLVTKQHNIAMALETLYASLACTYKPLSARTQAPQHSDAASSVVTRTLTFPVLNSIFNAVCTSLCTVIEYVIEKLVSSFAYPVLECMISFLELVADVDEMLGKQARPVAANGAETLRFFVVGRLERTRALETGQSMVDIGKGWISSSDCEKIYKMAPIIDTIRPSLRID